MACRSNFHFSRVSWLLPFGSCWGQFRKPDALKCLVVFLSVNENPSAHLSMLRWSKKSQRKWRPADSWNNMWTSLRDPLDIHPHMKSHSGLALVMLMNSIYKVSSAYGFQIKWIYGGPFDHLRAVEIWLFISFSVTVISVHTVCDCFQYLGGKKIDFLFDLARSSCAILWMLMSSVFCWMYFSCGLSILTAVFDTI